MITLESAIQEWKTKCGIDDFGKNQDILIEIIKQHHLTIQLLTLSCPPVCNHSSNKYSCK